MAARNPINKFEYKVAIPATSLCSYVNHRTISTAETETVPTWARHMVLTADGDCWFNANGAAVVPVSDVTDGTGSTFLRAGNARAFEINGSESLSVIAASGTIHASYEYFP